MSAQESIPTPFGRVLPRCHPAVRPRTGAALRDTAGSVLRAGGRGPGTASPARMVLGWLIVCLMLAVPAADAQLEVGVARAEFELPRHVPLAGYSRRGGKPSQGIHDPVGVRALVLRDGSMVAAVVSCDLLIIDEHLFDAVNGRLREAGLPPSLVLLLAATHTHSGPGAYGSRFLEKISMGHFDPDVFDAIVRRIAQTVQQAFHDLGPADTAYRTAQTNGLVVNRMDPHGPVENAVVVSAFFRHGQAAPFAVVVSFSAHPTTLGAWNMQLSADYPGVLVRAVERQVPGATCLFLAGSVGDQAPAKSGDRFERAERIGGPLAEQVVKLLTGIAPEPPGTLSAQLMRAVLPPAQVRLGHRICPRWLGRLLVDDDATLSLITVGRTVLFGMPCDVSAALGDSLQAAASVRGLHPIVVGFANDYIGYCVPPSLYVEKQYESSMAFNGPNAGQQLVDQLIRMLDHTRVGGATSP